MKSNLIGKKEQKKQKYPYLGIFSDGEVVLFISPDTGFAVHHPEKFNPHFSHSWDERQAKPLRGEIVLSN